MTTGLIEKKDELQEEADLATKQIQDHLRTWLMQYKDPPCYADTTELLKEHLVHLFNDIWVKPLLPVSTIPEVVVVQDPQDPSPVHVTFAGFEKMSPWDRQIWLDAFQQTEEYKK